MTIGQRIRERRERLGLGQTELADRVGISKQTLYKYENGIITNIPSDKIEAISKVLNVSPGNLMGWSDNIDYVVMAEDAPMGENLTPNERLIIARYREIPDAHKGTFLGQILERSEEFMKGDNHHE